MLILQYFELLRIDYHCIRSDLFLTGIDLTNETADFGTGKISVPFIRKTTNVREHYMY